MALATPDAAAGGESFEVEVAPGGVHIHQFAEACAYGIGWGVSPKIEGKGVSGSIEIETGRYTAAHSLATGAFCQIAIPLGTPCDGEHYIRFHNTSDCVAVFGVDTDTAATCAPLGAPCGSGSSGSSASASGSKLEPLTVHPPNGPAAMPLGESTKGRAGFADKKPPRRTKL